MGRSGKPVKVRAVDPSSFGAKFGALVRRRREASGLLQMDVARLVYNDETKVSRVSDLEAGRYAKLHASTVNSYRLALKISQADVDECRRQSSSENMKVASISDLRTVLKEILNERDADRPTANAVEKALDNIETGAGGEVGNQKALQNVVFQFLENIGYSRTPIYLWLAILNELAIEIVGIRQHPIAKNFPAEILKFQKLADEALGRGDYDTARAELEKVRAWNESEYLESRLTLENNTENYVRTLSQIASLFLSQGSYAEARNRYVDILALTGLPVDQRLRYARLATISYSALINLAGDYAGARSVFDEMLAANVKPDEVTYSTLINLAPDYAGARSVFDEMLAANVKPNEVTYSTLINLAPDYAGARACSTKCWPQT